jgi:hypothetical protein
VKIPGAERAVLDPAKTQNYLLSQEHAVGRAKARFFAQIGFDQQNWTILRDELYRFASLERNWALPLDLDRSTSYTVRSEDLTGGPRPSWPSGSS